MRGQTSLLTLLFVLGLPLAAGAQEGSAPSGSANGFYGGYQDSVPIELPSYRAITPAVSLGYSSGGGNGLAGVGWSLSGFETIQRTQNRTGAPKYDGSDTFVYAGEELLPCASGMVAASCAAGGSHTTRVEGYAKIAYDAGANQWTVWQRDGTRAVFTAVYGTSKGTYRWGIRKVIDVHGNTVWYAWWCGGGDCYPASIDYNGVHVAFHREARPDLIQFGNGVGLATTRYRLQTIDVLVDGQRLRTYALRYTAGANTGRSLLEGIQQYGRDASLNTSGAVVGGTAQPPAAGRFQPGGVGLAVRNQYPHVQYVDGYMRLLSGDFNGDGRSDFLHARSGWATAQLYLATGSGFQKLEVTHPANGVSNHTIDGYTLLRVADFDGDGSDDVLHYRHAWRSAQWYSSTGTNLTRRADFATGAYGVDGSSRHLVADFDGDGRADWLHARSGWGTAQLHLASGAGFVKRDVRHPASGVSGNIIDGYTMLQTGSFDGDRRADVLHYRHAWSSAHWYSSTGTDLVRQGNLGTGAYGVDGNSRHLVGDFNGDGLSDWLHVRHGWTYAQLHLSTGSGFVRQDVTHPASAVPSHTVDGYTMIQAGDFDGDGRTDVLHYRHAWSAAQWYVSRATGFTRQPDIGTGAYGVDGASKHLVADFDGDGRPDWLHMRRGWPVLQLHRASTSGAPDLMTSMTTPTGAQVSVGYTPSSAWSNTNNPPLVQTVSSVTTNDGRGGSTTVRYAYTGGLYDREDRRFLGFRYTKKTLPCISGESACPYEQTWWRQDYGSVSMPERVDIRSGAGTLLASKRHTYWNNGPTLPYRSLETQVWGYAYDSSGTYRRTVLTRAYDSWGNIVTEINYGDYDQAGDERRVQYDYVPNPSTYVLSRPGRIQGFAGTTSSGALLSEQQFTYDGATSWQTAPTKGNLTRTAKWLDATNAYVVSTQTYDGTGNVLSQTDPLGNVTGYVFDGSGERLVRLTNALGQVEQRSYDPVCGTVASVTDANGNTATSSYDALCRRVRTDGPLGGFGETRFVNTGDPQSQYVEILRPGAPGQAAAWQRKYLDGLGRPYRIESTGPSASRPVRQDFGFDARGNVERASSKYYAGDPVYWVSRRFDAMDRAVEVTYPNGTVERKTYGLGWVRTVSPSGLTTLDVMNAQGHVVAHEEYEGASVLVTSYEYDLDGHLVSTVDPAGNETRHGYDSLGRRTWTEDTDRGRWTFAFDALDREVSHTDALGQRMELDHDALGRRVAKRVRGSNGELLSTYTWTYDEVRVGYANIGRVTSTSDAHGGMQLDHDARGRVVRATRTTDGRGYTFEKGYDAAGRLLWTSYPDGDSIGTPSAPLTYDAVGQVRSVPGVVDAVEYTADGQVTRQENANGTVTTRTYAPGMGWLTSERTVRGTALVQDRTYTRTREGRLSSVSSPFAGESWDYGYDARLRLVSATHVGAPADDQAFTYDTLGRQTYNSRVGEYTYGAAQPHSVQTAGGNAYTYDANGNTLTGGGRTLQWNAENRLAQVWGPEGTATFGYDGDGRRVVMSDGAGVHHFVGDDYEVRDVNVPGQTEVTKYLSVGGVLVARKVGSELRWVHTDHQGSTNVETDGNGAVLKRLTYRPYGEAIVLEGAEDAGRSYTGQRVDSTGLVYLHARYMDPVLGRFLSADPTYPTSLQIGLDRYGYAFADPINQTDVDGLGLFSSIKNAFDSVVDAVKGVVGAVVGAVKDVWNAAKEGYQKLVNGVAQIPVVGGLLSTALMAHPAYAILTGDVEGFLRASATIAIMAAAYWATAGLAAAYTAGTIGAGTYIGGAAAVGYGQGYATARVNGASHSDALKAAQTGAVLSGATAAMNVFMQSMATTELEDRGLAGEVGPEPQAYHGDNVPNFTGTENGTSIVGENGWLGNAARDVPYGNYLGLTHDGFVTSLGDPGGLLGLAVNQGTHGAFVAMTIGSAMAQSGAIAIVVGDAAMAQAHRGDARSGSIWGFIAGGTPDLARGYVFGPIHSNL